MADHKNNEARPMLIFIPDISGFSKFVNDTEISHSQHIIEELLELIINSNEINLKVSEVEGDAILFYKEGDLDSFDTLVDQVKSMYTQFHTHLKLYEHNRICQCGACSSANSLSLKFVVSYGEVGFNNIKNHEKLFGKEVIIAHRLLKNNISVDEYALFSENLLKSSEADFKSDNIDWTEVIEGSDEYDIGTIEYKHFTLSPLLRKIPTPKLEDYGLKGVKTEVLEHSAIIEAPLGMVFNVLSDLSLRHLWNDNIKASDKLNGVLTKNGSTHRCLINDNKFDPFLVAHDFETSPRRIVFSETDSNVGLTVVNELFAESENTTKLTTHTFIEGKIFKPLLFKLFFKKKIVSSATEGNNRINQYCKDLISKGEKPANEIVFTVI